ncbi:4'-phosphopantetheinyl transferase superfamily protein [Streptomyces sp. NPDC000151]|uniref:4'-phosphopantetheinyl transferase family protein n=1 Tax=Streptomyces sp. NPDC000151 TaxID=3154244 RepID=UPI00331A8DFF
MLARLLDPGIKGLMADIVPVGVEVAQSTCDVSSGATDRELESLGWAVPARRAEFVTGRALARKVLSAVGAPSTDLVRTSSGAPAWPQGFTGSITHCSGFRAAAVAARRDVRALGIDAEPHRPLADELVNAIATPGERRGWPTDPGLWPETVAFSAKEAACKALYGLGASLLDFAQLRIELRGLCRLGEGAWRGRFDARLHRTRQAPGLPADVTGRWLVTDSLVFTAVVLETAAGMGRCA